MSFYEQRISIDLETIRKEVLSLGRSVDEAVKNSVLATLKGDKKLAYQTIIADAPINRFSEKITADCHAFIARHLPSAGHLRFISSALRLVVLLERVGDYAATISRESVQLETPLAGVFRKKVEELASDATKMFDLALNAFHDQDSLLASGTITMARKIDHEFAAAYSTLADERAGQLSNADIIRRLIIISQLERVSDQAKNLCEETVFFITGETKKRRPVQILFISESDDRFTQLAVAIGRKYCSDRADFDSLGFHKVSDLQPDLFSFLEEHGFDTDDLAPRTAEKSASSWGNYDVIVCFDQSFDAAVDKVPYLSVVLDWRLPGADSAGGSKSDADSAGVSNSGAAAEKEIMEDGYRYLRNRIEELVSTLRGEAREGD